MNNTLLESTRKAYAALIDNVKTEMAVRGVTAREICRKTGLTDCDVSRYLSGKVVPSAEKFLCLMVAMDVDLNACLDSIFFDVYGKEDVEA